MRLQITSGLKNGTKLPIQIAERSFCRGRAVFQQAHLVYPECGG
jgi:hypothetical protein